VQWLRATDAGTIERAASLRFGQQLVVLAHDGLKSLPLARVAGQGFSVGEICLDAMSRLQKLIDDGGDPRTATSRIRFRFAQGETGEELLKEWTEWAEAGAFADQIVVLTLCPQEVTGKKLDRLVAALLDPTKGKAAAVVVPTDAADVRHFAAAIVQAGTATGVAIDPPRAVLEKGFDTNLYGLAHSRTADDRTAELEKWFPWSSEEWTDYLTEVVKDDKVYAEFVRQQQKHRRGFVVLP
jgi:hypothetical protein